MQRKQHEQTLSEGHAGGPAPAASEIAQISQSLQSMQINSNLGNGISSGPKSHGFGGPSSKMQANQAGLLNQIQPGSGNGQYKTPSMAFLESKRREEEKQMHTQHSNYP